MLRSMRVLICVYLADILCAHLDSNSILLLVNVGCAIEAEALLGRRLLGLHSCFLGGLSHPGANGAVSQPKHATVA